MEQYGSLFANPLFTFVLGAVAALLCVRVFRSVGRARGTDEAKGGEIATATTPAAVAAAAGGDENLKIVAAISAAVYVALGAHRLVFIGEAHPAFGWTSELRTRLHLSHTPRSDRH